MSLESYNYLDSLTGLKNRVKLHEDLHKNHYTLMAIINIDRVNFINNLYGSSIGD
ncbi:MAG TPA: diguanylate cyclase, partial [Campylobacterales bacterium]|nr:diguanylate cyclase [Campylobacterales bacterium]